MLEAYRMDRRQFKRLRINLAVVYQVLGPGHVLILLGGRQFEAETVDLSSEGTAMIVDHYLPAGTQLSLNFILFESNHTGWAHFYEILSAAGQITSILPLDNERYRAGICFEDISESSRARLNDILRSSLKFTPSLPRPRWETSRDCALAR